MTIDAPTPAQLPALKTLWQQVFGDTDAFIELFFDTAFSSDRCRCLCIDSQPVSVVYWFDTQYEGHKLAYLYAIATEPNHRKKGYCQQLLADTHCHLQSLGYAGTLLMPAEPSLFQMYEKMGYTTCCYNRTFSRHSAGTPVLLTRLTSDQYAALRAPMLPYGSVGQEGVMWAFLEKLLEFYQTEDTLFAYYREGDTAYVREILGPAPHPENLIAGLGCTQGYFRTPGHQTPFAMFHPLGKAIAFPPSYLGFSLD